MSLLLQVQVRGFRSYSEVNTFAFLCYAKTGNMELSNRFQSVYLFAFISEF